MNKNYHNKQLSLTQCYNFTNQNISTMKLKSIIMAAFIFSALASTSCGGSTETKEASKTAEPKIKEVPVTYKADTVTSNSYITFDESKESKRPVVLIIPEWWGLGSYVRGRAKQLAEMGYVAMSVDMYGNGKTAEDPKSAGELATPFYKDPQLTKIKIDAALNKLKEFPQADMSQVAAIGYCFGGYSVLNAAKLGADLKGVVSFHGRYQR